MAEYDTIQPVKGVVMSDLAVLSKACEGQMHYSCSGCGCTVCHHTCTRCGRPCKNVYEGGICVSCHMNDLSQSPAIRARCEKCGGANAYRDLRVPDCPYLCTECHKSQGHRYQVNGEWVTA